MRILFAGGGTGGHLYPGLAIARALVAARPDVQPFFVGAQRGIERELLPASGFPFELLDLHPLYRTRLWENWRTAVGLAGAWRTLGRLTRERRPAALVATGGYASGAAVAYAAANRIPVALQEQNSYPGITTRLTSRVASEIYLGYREAAHWLTPRRGAVVEETGNPIDPPPEPRPDRAAARARWGFPEVGGQVLLAFGGSQGARALNAALAGWVERGLPDDIYVIWATGKASYDDVARYEAPRVRVVAYLSPIGEAYAAADLAFTRAGALTAAELCAWGIPAILVPLPTAAADHQTGNARALADAKAALLLPQRDLTVARLDETVRSLLEHPERLADLAAAAAAKGRPHAAREIAGRVLRLAEGSATKY